MIDQDFANQAVMLDKTEGGVYYVEHGSPSELIRWHAHEPYELHLIVDTKGKVFVGDYVGRYQPGQLILTGPNVPHNWVTDKESCGDVDLRDMVILFKHDAIESLVKSFSEAQELMATLELSRSGIEFVGFNQAEAEALFAEVRDAHGMHRLLAFLKLLNKINQWPHKRTLSTAKMESPLTGIAESKINDVVQYISDHYQEDLSLKHVASLVNMSESSFSRHFQRATCNKFVEFVNRVRIGRACILLAETDSRISSICFEVGFNNVTNFNRQFVKMKGRTPGQYRKIIQANLGQDQAVIEPTIGYP